MKGTLINNDDGWEVQYKEFFRVKKENGIPVDTEYLIKTLPLHYEDVERLSFRSDKKPEDIIGEEVEFEIIENQKMSGISKYAKIIEK